MGVFFIVLTYLAAFGAGLTAMAYWDDGGEPEPPECDSCPYLEAFFNQKDRGLIK